ncbi:MAG: leucyl aminopeptidase family protein, partial [Betaproteobacteria bacterium]|nr:leucyl aminopeptidase family protein [Betaproteobacteria bacterium]
AIVIPPSPHESSHAAWRELACRALFVAAANGQYELGKPPGKTAPRHLQNIHLFGIKNGSDCADALALAGANLLARSLTLRPANDLTPKQYRADIATLAKQQGWQRKEYPYATLRKMGAGAFCAVAQGSDHTDAAIVHLSYRPTGAKSGKASPIALIGKGICMDTGGHGLKPAKSMYGMHEDMAGSAVVLGIMAAATAMKLPVPLDAWLAISQNHIGPKAYHPGDVVTALNGTTIEVVHTDAEGRMVLADTLTLAARQKPRAMIDFATLTGAMVYALGTRQCGIFTNREALAAEAVTCGQHSGERISVLPLDADYDEELESKVADVKQCLIAGEADAIYAARFLHRFVDNTPWVHLDLSAYRHDGGLGAIAGDVNGFGVAWGVEMVRGVKQ